MLVGQDAMVCRGMMGLLVSMGVIPMGWRFVFSFLCSLWVCFGLVLFSFFFFFFVYMHGGCVVYGEYVHGGNLLFP